jgi:hypothetical protein
MKIIITCEDEDLDRSVEEVVRIASKAKDYEWKDYEIKSTGTSLILEK